MTSGKSVLRDTYEAEYRFNPLLSELYNRSDENGNDFTM